MAGYEQEPFKWNFTGELASENEIAAMETLALRLLEHDDAITTITSQYSYCTEDGSTVLLEVLEDARELHLGSYASITIGHEDDEYQDEFLQFELGYDNLPITLTFADSDLENALRAVEDLSENGALDADGHVLMNHMQLLVRSLTLGAYHPDAHLTPNTGNEREFVGNVIRRQVLKNAQFSTCRIKYGAMTDEDTLVHIDSYELMGSPGFELGVNLLPTLQITYEDRRDGCNYSFVRYFGEHAELTVSDIYMTELQDEDEAINDAVTELQDDLGLLIPSKADIERITKALHKHIATRKSMSEACAAESSSEPDEKWAYPILPFNLTIDEGLVREDQAKGVQHIVSQSLTALSAASTVTLPELCPDGYPVQPNYTPGRRKLFRISNYLQQSVTVKTDREKIRGKRRSILDVTGAVEQVLDQISHENHPVAQIALRLYSEYSPKLGQVAVDSAVVELVTLTHWPRVKDELNKQIQAMRPQKRPKRHDKAIKHVPEALEPENAEQ